MITASIYKRILATAADIILFGILYVLVIICTSLVHEHFTGKNGSGDYYGVGIPASGFLWFIGGWLLFISLTEFYTGQSIGKRFLKIKVVKTDGSKYTFLNALSRHLLDLIDLILIVSLAIIPVSRNKQRIGDMIVGTYVVPKE